MKDALPLVIGISVVLGPALLARLAWHRRPSTARCALFWLATGWWFVWSPHDALAGIAAFGMSLNALVTLSNRGRMPCAYGASGMSVWVTRTPSHRFGWLGDNYRVRGFGDVSVGDVLIGVYLLTQIGRALVEGWK